MLAVSQVSKSYHLKTVLNGVTFTLKPGEKSGLVGPNGCGKTTLMRILNGLESPDQGSVRFTPASIRKGYLAQGIDFSPQISLGEVLAASENPALIDAPARLEELAGLLAKSPDQPELQAEYDSILAALEQADSLEAERRAVLSALGLDQMPLDTPAGHLSGGQKTRLSLARILLTNPDILFLDEPTNHLDIEMLEWLGDWLRAFRGTALIISHDRAFLDDVADSILELNPFDRKIKRYEGNYSEYIAAKEAETVRQMQAYQDQQDEIRQLHEASAHLRGIGQFRKGGKADTGDKFARGFFANRGKATIGRAKSMERRIETLLTDERVDKPQRSWQMKIDFERGIETGRDVLVLDDLSVGYPGVPPLVTGASLTLKFGQRVALIGPNGCGKTSLLRTILGSVLPVTGAFRFGSGVKVGYMAQEQENLNPVDTALSALQQASAMPETDARRFLSKFLFKQDDVFTRVQDMSFGERVRLSLALQVASGCNLLLLDEPINHLDIPARVRFEEALRNFEGSALAVVHDRYFIRQFATSIWEIKEGTLRVVA